jgi:hypothetical protein
MRGRREERKVRRERRGRGQTNNIYQGTENNICS